MKRRPPEFSEKQRVAALKDWANNPQRREAQRQCMEKMRARDPRFQRAHLGKKHSPKTKEKLRQINLGREASPETREKIRQAHLGKKHTPQSKEKLRQARLKRVFPQKMTGIERSLQHEFQKRRLKFEMHKTMFGRFQPDFVFEFVKLIVQADGDYWHRQGGSKGSGKMAEQDARFNKMAHEDGWTVWRFAESEIKQHPAACGRAVARFVRSH